MLRITCSNNISVLLLRSKYNFGTQCHVQEYKNEKMD
jgi:hypothetical protein